MRYLYYFVWLIIFALGVTFGALNSQTVHLDYYIHTSAVYLPLLLVVVLAIGVLLGWLFLSPTLIKAKNASRQLKKRAEQAEEELKQLRQAPIKGDN